MPNIVISYRRDDSPGTVGWIHEKLSNHYGANSVFRDIDSVAYAIDFRKSIGRALRRCDVMLALVGPRWTGGTAGNPSRIQETNDWVRVEIETALQLDVPIIPVLIDGAKMPPAEELPDTIRELAFRNGLSVDSGTEFYRHIERLISAINQQASADTHKAETHSPANAAAQIDISPAHPVDPSPKPEVLPPRGLLGKLIVPFRFIPGDTALAKAGKIFGDLVVYYFYFMMLMTFVRVMARK
jgi:hypothetical protein